MWVAGRALADILAVDEVNEGGVAAFLHSTSSMGLRPPVATSCQLLQATVRNVQRPRDGEEAVVKDGIT